MAKFGAPIMVDTIRGKIGGVVFTKARSGPTVRVRVKPSNPRTAAQVGARTRLTTVARQWAGLTGTQRSAWISAATAVTLSNGVGGTFHPSGNDYYNGLAAKYLQVTPGGTPPTSPPSSPFSGDTITVTAVGAAGKITFTPSASNGAGIKTELLVQKLPSAGRAASPSGYRSKSFVTFSGTTPIDVTGLSAGTYVAAYRFVLTATGQQSGLVIQVGQLTVT